MDENGAMCTTVDGQYIVGKFEWIKFVRYEGFEAILARGIFQEESCLSTWMYIKGNFWVGSIGIAEEKWCLGGSEKATAVACSHRRLKNVDRLWTFILRGKKKTWTEESRSTT